MSYHGIGATRTPLATRSTSLIDLTKRGTTAPVTALVATPASTAKSSSSKWLIGGGLVGAFILAALIYKKGWLRR